MLFGLHSFAPYVAASGGNIGDIVGPIIVFIVIAIQLMRAAKAFTKNKPSVQKPAAKPQSPSSADEALRDFLGSLSGESKPAPVSAPMQPVIPPLRRKARSSSLQFLRQRSLSPGTHRQNRFRLLFCPFQTHRLRWFL